MSAEDFEFEFTEEAVIEMLRGNEEAEDWYDAMCEILPLWEMNTPERVAMFVAQCGHESNNFKVLSENLNYSAKALDSLFGKYFKRQVEMRKNIIDNLVKLRTLFTQAEWTTVPLIPMMAGDLGAVAYYNLQVDIIIQNSQKQWKCPQKTQ